MDLRVRRTMCKTMLFCLSLPVLTSEPQRHIAANQSAARCGNPSGNVPSSVRSKAIRGLLEANRASWFGLWGAGPARSPRSCDGCGGWI